jgi:Arc/MetJ-type ribon-helix-helix transcriptional regulator
MTRPIQVYLDEQEMAALESWSRRRGWNKSQAVRAAVRALTRSQDGNGDDLLAARGMIDGLPKDLSARFDHYLEGTYVAKTPRPSRRAGRRSPPRVRR